ncbi:SpoIID/LytB domain-containing protein, partial [Ilumatobacter sp.]|uniref:SpoIID/LytB domain-containing protein n=1 Tax=Ilumatobacter sp. TaxID=1967498 RepID=UPI003AF496DD
MSLSKNASTAPPAGLIPGATPVAMLVVMLMVSSLVLLVGPAAVDAAPAGDDQVIAFEVRGVGNGHGRGLSQWGAHGRALDGQTWQQILGAYYGGTQPATRSEPHMRVRLTPWDGVGTVGVISTSGTARWNSNTTNYTSLHTVETSPNVFSVYGAVSGRACPGAGTLTIPFVHLQLGSSGTDVERLQEFLNRFGFDAGAVDGQFGPATRGAVERFQGSAGLTVDGLWRNDDAAAAQAMVDGQSGSTSWEHLASGVAGPIRFSTTANQSTSAPGSVLGVCRSTGGVTHYRGAIEVVHTSAGNRVVNDVDVENYLRGVLPKEVPPSWGDAGGGAGMNALRAQAVAARSFGMSQGRYSYAGTCDTSSCQVYGGAATRVSVSSSTAIRVEHPNTDRAIDDTDGAVRVWPNGSVVSTEFSASNGPRTAGGAFPAVDDPWDDVSGNPNHRWTRIIDADKIISRYGLSTANGVRTRVDADSPYEGIWANEVVLGNGSVVSAWNFRNAFGLRAPGFELVPIRRDVTGAADMVFIGDSVGASVASSPLSE